jgi:hypothetical protein
MQGSQSDERVTSGLSFKSDPASTPTWQNADVETEDDPRAVVSGFPMPQPPANRQSMPFVCIHRRATRNASAIVNPDPSTIATIGHCFHDFICSARRKATNRVNVRITARKTGGWNHFATAVAREMKMPEERIRIADSRQWDRHARTCRYRPQTVRCRLRPIVKASTTQTISLPS